jgi:hypothetical protein
MKRWIPCELHTHTKNSDGNYTLLELVNKAKEIGLECIALTDHNTISGYPQITDEVIKTGIQIIRGIEWTTFYGHMVVLGAKKYVDWRTAGPADIKKALPRSMKQEDLRESHIHMNSEAPFAQGAIGNLRYPTGTI